MVSCTPTEDRWRGRLADTSRDTQRYALVVGVPEPASNTLRQALKQADLAPYLAQTSQQITDALYDADVTLAFVQFGRNIPQGTAVCRSIRKHPSGQDVPILALLDERASAGFPIDCGADDVLLAPYTPEAALLRLRLCLWRCDVSDRQDVVKLGDVAIDTRGMHVRVRGNPIDLTYKEFALLTHFIHHPGVALARAGILDAVWGDEYYGGDRTVDIHVRRLRAKLPDLARYIETVHGVGYRFVGTGR